MNPRPIDLFVIDGVAKQREIQCSNCPDGKSILPEGVKVKPHRCHATPDALCAGPCRPRILGLAKATTFDIFLGCACQCCKDEEGEDELPDDAQVS